MTHAARLAPLALAVLTACAASPPLEPVPPAASAGAPTTAAVAPLLVASVAPPAAPAAPSAAAAPSAMPTAAPSAPVSPCPDGMAFIPGGEYPFGVTPKEKVTVAVKAFCLDTNETSTAEYAACAKGGKCDTSRLTVCDPSTYAKPPSAKLPMVCVDFDQADRYCKAVDKRLPSTEEWEWAARGASATSPHPWGDADAADKICWRRGAPCELGSFPAGDSPQGVHDLIGGVFEWTSSKSDGTTTNRVVRGGSWKDYAPELFSVARQGIFKASYRCGFGGIRCVKPLPDGAAAGPAPASAKP